MKIIQLHYIKMESEHNTDIINVIIIIINVIIIIINVAVWPLRVHEGSERERQRRRGSWSPIGAQLRLRLRTEISTGRRQRHLRCCCCYYCCYWLEFLRFHIYILYYMIFIRGNKNEEIIYFASALMFKKYSKDLRLSVVFPKFSRQTNYAKIMLNYATP